MLWQRPLLPSTFAAAHAASLHQRMLHHRQLCNVALQAAHADAMAPAGLSPEEWRTVPLVKKEKVNYNTVHLRFGLEEGNTAGLNVASCLVVRAPIGKPKEDGSPGYMIRPYTPVSRPHEKGHFDLMVKVRRFQLPCWHTCHGQAGVDRVVDLCR